METLEQKHSCPEASGTEVVQARGHNTAHTHITFINTFSLPYIKRKLISKKLQRGKKKIQEGNVREKQRRR